MEGTRCLRVCSKRGKVRVSVHYKRQRWCKRGVCRGCGVRLREEVCWGGERVVSVSEQEKMMLECVCLK